MKRIVMVMAMTVCSLMGAEKQRAQVLVWDPTVLFNARCAAQ